MQSGNIAPVDWPGILGPGMAIYSRYKGVLEPGGKTAFRPQLHLA